MLRAPLFPQQEEVSQTGIRVGQSSQRTPWHGGGGNAFTWLGTRL